MSERIEAVRGTKDVLPCDSHKWRYIESIACETAHAYGFNEVRFPTFEKTELFRRGVGDTTDVVQKEMYTFATKGETSITLRPEGTASVARLCLQNGLFAGLMPLKLFYIISCFRYEKPQAGRYREFHQFGVELYGSKCAEADSEVISLAYNVLKRLGLGSVSLRINSIGCPNCRKRYNEALKAYFKDHYNDLCETCRQRLDRNPMRILDCKSVICSKIASSAPKITDFLCEECQEHFKSVQNNLNNMGINYTIDTSIVRGLDYYTKTVFEFVDTESGLTLLGGGRYDGLIDELDEKQSVPGLGFAMGIERIIMLMTQRGLSFGPTPKCMLFIANLGDKGCSKAAELSFKLRQDNICVQTDLMKRSLKAQMKYADKIGAQYTMVIGDNEVNTESAKLRNMNDGSEKTVSLSDLKTWF